MKPKKATFLVLCVILVVAAFVVFVPMQVFSYQLCNADSVPKRISIIKGQKMSTVKDKIETQQVKEETMDCLLTEANVKLYIL